MSKCKENRLTTLLKSKGYNAVLLPREDIQPLRVLEMNKKLLKEVGELGELIISSTDLPKLNKDKRATNFSGFKSSAIDVSLGLDFLSGILAGLGIALDKIGLKTSYKNAKKLVYSFENVLEDKITEVALDKYISTGKANKDSNVFKNKLHDSKLYVITSVLKSDTFNVASLKENETAVEVELPVVENLIGGELKVEYKGDSKSVTSYQGNKKLIFGFRAVQLIFDEQKLADLKSTDIAMRSNGETELLISESGILDIEKK